MSTIRKVILEQMPTLTQKHLLMNKLMDELERINNTVALLNTCSEDRRIVIDVVIEPKNKIE